MHDTLKKHKVTLISNKEVMPIIARRVRPNDQCSCGSGKKAKNCCGTETKYYGLKKAV